MVLRSSEAGWSGAMATSNSSSGSARPFPLALMYASLRVQPWKKARLARPFGQGPERGDLAGSEEPLGDREPAEIGADALDVDPDFPTQGQGENNPGARVRQVETDRQVNTHRRIKIRLAVGVGDEPERAGRSIQVAAQDRPEQPPTHGELATVAREREAVGPLQLIDVSKRARIASTTSSGASREAVQTWTSSLGRVVGCRLSVVSSPVVRFQLSVVREFKRPLSRRATS